MILTICPVPGRSTVINTAGEGKCEGRKSWAEINPELVREAKRLRRRLPKGGQRSLRDVAAELPGWVTSTSGA